MQHFKDLQRITFMKMYLIKYCMDRKFSQINLPN